ncbi:MAG: ABC transporter permease [Candidatus Omnitrophota bacterium]|nr:MAG: ABC transporter permease [Candidatus Omnitrophota bacterium]
MIQYILRRLAHMIPILLGITIISFTVIHLAPGKPTDLMVQLNPKVDFEAREKLNQIYGFDKPLHIQYMSWLRKLARFDFGRSFVDNRRVLEKIFERLPITILINVLAMTIIFLFSIPIGIKSAVRRGSIFDRTTTVFVFLGFAAPSFWLGLLLMFFFGVKLGILPVSGIVSLDFENYAVLDKVVDILRHLILPVTVASVGGLAGVSRYMRQSMLNVISQDYIRTARAKGLPERAVIYKHALRNALLPIITILGLSIPGLISGSVILETIFSIPGVGRLMVESVFTRDYNVIMAGLVISALLTLLGNLMADIAYVYADPRIRYKK